MDLSLNEVRRCFSRIGYKATFKKHPLIENCKKLTVTDSEGNFVAGGGNNVYHSSEWAKHKEAFNMYGCMIDKTTSEGIKIK